MAKAWPGKKGDSVLHITSNQEGGRFANLLKKKGFQASRLVVYRNEGPQRLAQPVREALVNEGVDWVVFSSGTAAERFRRLVPRWPVEPKVAVIGPATVRKARKVGWKVRALAKQVSAEGVIQAILKSIQ